jgi:hypothetical protein
MTETTLTAIIYTWFLIILIFSILLIPAKRKNNVCPDNCIDVDCYIDYNLGDCLCFDITENNTKYCLNKINVLNESYDKYINYSFSMLILIITMHIIEYYTNKNNKDDKKLSSIIIILLLKLSFILIIMYSFFHYVFDASDSEYYEKCSSNCFLNECDNIECKCYDFDTDDFTCDYSHNEINHVYEKYNLFYKINIISILIIFLSILIFGFYILIIKIFNFVSEYFNKNEYSVVNQNNEL